MSQIGYMFIGVGMGALLERDVPPHDARLLQGAALHDGGPRDPRDRRRAGHPQATRGRAMMPFTKWCFLAGALALVGVPPFAGFFSKDPIIAAALERSLVRLRLLRCGSPAPSSRASTRSGSGSSFSPASRARSCASTTTTTTAVRAPGRCSCRSGSSRCSPPSAAGSSSRRTGSRSPVARAGRADARRRRAERRRRRSPPSSPCSLGVAGIASRGPIYAEQRLAIPKMPACGGCSRTSSTSTALRPAFYAPAAALATACAPSSRSPSSSRAARPRRHDTRHREARTPDPDRPAPHLCLVPRRRRGGVVLAFLIAK